MLRCQAEPREVVHVDLRQADAEVPALRPAASCAVASASARLRGWRSSAPPTTPMACGLKLLSTATSARAVLGVHQRRAGQRPARQERSGRPCVDASAGRAHGGGCGGGSDASHGRVVVVEARVPAAHAAPWRPAVNSVTVSPRMLHQVRDHGRAVDGDRDRAVVVAAVRRCRSPGRWRCVYCGGQLAGALAHWWLALLPAPDMRAGGEGPAARQVAEAPA